MNFRSPKNDVIPVSLSASLILKTPGHKLPSILGLAKPHTQKHHTQKHHTQAQTFFHSLSANFLGKSTEFCGIDINIVKIVKPS